MQRSKLTFSDAELQMACNQEIILTKNRIIDKVYDQFGEIGRNLFDILEPLQKAFPEETGMMPKISKGERYRELPWVMLDYPRWYNHKRGHFALRVMFWWGNYYLVQIQISGIYLPAVLKKTEEWVKRGEISGSEWWMGFPVDPWDFSVPQAGIMDANDFMKQNPFSKSGIFKILMIEPLDGKDIMPSVEKLALLLTESLGKGI
jgi:hypothetical protein